MDFYIQLDGSLLIDVMKDVYIVLTQEHHVEGDKSFRKVDEVDTKKIFETLDKLKSLGVFRMLLTGGELFLRKDLFEILHYINKLRISYTIFTNGTLLDEEKSKKYQIFIQVELNFLFIHQKQKIMMR